MRDKPWQAIDLITDETLGWYETETKAYLENMDKAITAIYRPGRKGKVKK